MTYYAITTERYFDTNSGKEVSSAMAVVPFDTTEQAREHLFDLMTFHPVDEAEFIDGEFVKGSGSLELGHGYTQSFYLNSAKSPGHGKLFSTQNYRVDSRKPF